MATAQRVLYETITVIVFLVVLAGTVIWSEARIKRRGRQLQDQQEQAIAEAESDFQRRQQELAEAYDVQSRERAIDEARAVFSAFESGVRSATGARWGNYLSNAKTDLLQHERVAFVHVLTQSGLVLASSDEKLSRSGRADERAQWALATTRLSIRDSTIPGHVELAAPMRQGGRPIGFLWIGYDIRSANDSAG